MFGDVKRFLDLRRGEIGSPAVRLEPALGFDVTNRRIDGGCYLFFDAAGSPRIVAKAARTGAGRAVFETEFRALEELQRRGVPAVPRPLGLGQIGRTTVAVQTALSGVPLKNVPGRELFSEQASERTIEAVLDWWRTFQRKMGVEAIRVNESVYARDVLAPLERFRRSYRSSDEAVEFLDRRLVRERRLSGARLPYMARHGDFCAANIMLADGTVGVFDWEFPLVPATPLFDLFFFFSSLRFPHGARGDSSHSESFECVFWEDGHFQTVVRRRLAEVCREFEIEWDWVGDLFVLSLIQTANMKYAGLLASHGLDTDEPERGAPSAEALKARWASFDGPDKNAPFAWIRAGAFEHLATLARRGLPDWLGDRRGAESR